MKSLPLLMLGAGGHARVLLDALQTMNVPVLGVTDPNSTMWGAKIMGVPVLGDDEQIANYSPGEVLLVMGMGSVGYSQARNKLFAAYKNQGYSFFSVVHPSACIAAGTRLGEGTQVMAGAVIQVGCVIGCNSIINTGTTVDHDCKIGDGVHIAPGVTISGSTAIGNHTFIGAGTTIIQGVKIGDSCLIGAGSVVLREIPTGSRAFGVPARITARITGEKS